MKFSYKFSLFIFTALLLMLVVNILALRYYSERYFAEYVAAVKKETPDINLDLVGSVIAGKWLDASTVEEYRATLRDLWSISSSLERFSKDPKAYTTLPANTSNSGLTNPLGREFFLGSTNTLLSRVLSFQAFGNDTPEGLFAFRVLRAMFFVNLFLVLCLILSGWAWVSFLFRPIRTIVSKIDGIASRREYSTIPYKRNDEFRPLLVAINDLSRNLAFQEKIRSDFLSDLSHEIKTPIAAIKCYLEWMQDKVIPLDEANLGLLFSEIERLIKITDTVMEVERVEGRAAADLRITRFDFVEALSQVVSEYSPMLRTKNQKIEYKADRRFNVSMDHDACLQILHNVFSNFSKYSGDSTTLTVRFSRTSTHTVFVFEDNGKWVNEKEVPFLREKFYQAERSRTYAPGKWAGIGLSVVEKIARLHGGGLEVESGLGKGFTLTLRLSRW